MQTIGERLEEARKKKGISIREAAEATKIRGDYLQKFESNQFDIGLTEIYTRGFLRNYANFLKLPAERILNDYATLGRGDVRPRQPSREIYGRMDISVATSGEPNDRAAPPAENATVAEPAPATTGARAQPRYPRSGGAAMPGGLDPALVFKYAKWGAIVVVVLLAVWGLTAVFKGNGNSNNAANSTRNGNPTASVAAKAPAATAPNFYKLIALDTVRIRVTKLVGKDTDGEEVIGWTTLSPGQIQTVPWNESQNVWASAGENVMLEYNGVRKPMRDIFTGYGFGQMLNPPGSR